MSHLSTNMGTTIQFSLGYSCAKVRKEEMDASKDVGRSITRFGSRET